MANAFRKVMDARSPLGAGIYCGCIAVLVDIDHAFKMFLFPEQGWRFLHLPILVACCIALCGCGAYCGGLYLRCILKRKNKRTNR